MNQKAKRTGTFDLTEEGLAAFYKTLTGDACVLVEATISTFAFVRLIRSRVKELVIANTL
ncbi:MAG: hypothetical protein LBC27_00350 [Spirochaetaceae bacterium]|nr:hypothetical protein [Spirochaetaceae bacterium]